MKKMDLIDWRKSQVSLSMNLSIFQSYGFLQNVGEKNFLSMLTKKFEYSKIQKEV